MASRMRRNIFLILFLLMAVPICADTMVQERLMSHHQGGRFPSVAAFSRIEDPLRPTHHAVRVVYQAMRAFYGKTWFDRYVHADERISLNRLHGNLLADVLPATFTVGNARIHPDYVLVPILLHSRDSDTRQWDLILSEDDRGAWKIVRLSLP